jgi:hypothetical protein
MNTLKKFVNYLKAIRKTNETESACDDAPCVGVYSIFCVDCPLLNARDRNTEKVHAAIDKFLAEQVTP